MRAPTRPILLLLVLAGLAVGLPTPAFAQVEPPPTDTRFEPYENRVVSEILVFSPADQPLPADLEQLARTSIRLTPGAPFQVETVSHDVTRLNRLGRFKSIDVSVQMLPDASVRVLYALLPHPIITDVQSVGNRLISDQDIAAAARLIPGVPVDEHRIELAAHAIEQLYIDKGYPLSRVDVDQEELESSGVVVFRIREGLRVRVTAIRFEGNRSFGSRALREHVGTEIAGLLHKGPLIEDRLQDDIASLIEFYRDRGYLDVRVDKLVTISPDGKQAIVTFVVEEGERYTLRDVTVNYPDRVVGTYPTRDEAVAAAQPGQQVLFTGIDQPGTPAATQQWVVYTYGVLSPEQIAGLVGIKPGDVYSVRKLRDAEQTVRDALGKLGYVESNLPGKVVRRELHDPTEPRVDMYWEIREGPRSHTGEVVIAGNTITKDAVVRGHLLDIEPLRLTDTTAIRESELRLQRTNLFERGGVGITIQQPDPDEPELRDVFVNVVETNTGNVNFGVTAGSDGGVNGLFSIQQRNFDIWDTPDSIGELFSGRAFRGGGQTLSLDLQPGSQFQNYSLSLTEPAVYGSDYALTTSGYFRDRDYDEYDEQRLGTSVSLRRRFGQRWSGGTRLRLESIDLTDIAPDRPVDVFAFEGQNGLTSIAFDLTRTTYDSPVLPTRGSRIGFGVEQFGLLGGEFHFTRLTAQHSVYFTLLENISGQRTVLALNTQAGWIPESVEEIPVYERFYLGGNSFRGFAFRGVSPIGIRNDTGEPGDDPVGGVWSFFWGAELRQPIVEDSIYGVVFLDTGTVINDIGFDDYRVSVGLGMRLLVQQLSPVPLAFDFGFPLVREDTDQRRLFTFAVDIPF